MQLQLIMIKQQLDFLLLFKYLVMNTKNIENKEMIKNKKRIKYNLSVDS